MGEREREREREREMIKCWLNHSLLLSPFQQWHVMGPRISW